MMEPKIDLRDYIEQRDVQFQPEIGEHYFDLLIRHACRLGKVERPVLLTLLRRLGWTEKTLDYHARLVRDCDSQVSGQVRRSTERLNALAAAFGLDGWFDDKFPVPRVDGEPESVPVRTSVVFRADPWDVIGTAGKN